MGDDKNDTTQMMNKSELLAEVYKKESGLERETFLDAVKGPDKGKRFLIAGPVTRIGRSSENHCVLNDPRVSSLHCTLRYLEDKSRYILIDEESTNGTFLNGKPCGEGLVRNGDRITVGDTVLLCRVPQAPAPEDETA